MPEAGLFRRKKYISYGIQYIMYENLVIIQYLIVLYSIGKMGGEKERRREGRPVPFMNGHPTTPLRPILVQGHVHGIGTN